jgi:pimeloyl-ACP methyl ester carboxylesterase
LSAVADPWVDDTLFHEDVHFIESLWQRAPIGKLDMPLIDIGSGDPLVFVPILEHLEFVYAHQIRNLSETHRVLMYRRHETRTKAVGLVERAEELRAVLDYCGLQQADFVAHGDAAMVLFEFAARYPQRCRSLVIIAQGADYHITPHPFIWLLHELFLRLPVEHVLSAAFLRRTVVNYITARDRYISNTLGLPRHLIEEQFSKIALWPSVYKFSVLPIIHYFDIRSRVAALTMPILLINRSDDVLSPEASTRWLALHLPSCASYHVVDGKERFFMYAQSGTVTPLIASFLSRVDTRYEPIKPVTTQTPGGDIDE